MARHVSIHSAGLQDIIDDLDELARMPSSDQVARLDGALATAFAHSQTLVHVDEGLLKASGRFHSQVDEAKGSWTGVIEYGGAVAPYAVYEMSNPGSEHDPFRELHVLDRTFVEALTEDTM